MPSSLPQSALRDRAFLEFFFRRIRRNVPPHRPNVSIAAQTFPFVSKCGVERNYLQTADSQLGRQATPIVFLEMVIASGELVDGEQIARFSLAGDAALIPSLHLRYAGGSLSVPFDPSALRSSADGSLYHLMPSDAPAGHADFGAGVCGSRLALQLGELISIDALSGRMSLRWAGRAIDIRPL